MSKNIDKSCSILQLLAKGRFTEIEKLCINNQKLRMILLHWRGIRQTAFFKKRLRFYKEFAKELGLREFTPEIKNQMREEFAKRHCLKQTLKNVIESYDIGALTTEMSRIRFNQMLRRKRQRKLGL